MLLTDCPLPSLKCKLTSGKPLLECYHARGLSHTDRQRIPYGSQKEIVFEGIRFRWVLCKFLCVICSGFGTCWCETGRGWYIYKISDNFEKQSIESLFFLILGITNPALVTYLSHFLHYGSGWLHIYLAACLYFSFAGDCIMDHTEAQYSRFSRTSVL